MRYIVALVIAAVLIGAVALFSWWNHDAIAKAFREQLQIQKEQGRLPPELQDIDLDTVEMKDYKMQVPTGLMRRVDAARMLAATWFLWSPIIILICLGLAALLGRRRDGA